MCVDNKWQFKTKLKTLASGFRLLMQYLLHKNMMFLGVSERLVISVSKMLIAQMA